MDDETRFTVTFRCAAGHEQSLSYGDGFNEDMVHDHAVLVAGGTLRSIGVDMPGYPCAWTVGPLPGVAQRACGAKVSFEVASHAPPSAPPPPPPVDRSRRCTVGEAVAPGEANTEDRGDGQQKGYVILCDDERAKGFVRPVRRSYRHLKCGTVTTMGAKLAETYARDPKFYSGTFCCGCGVHRPVGADGEFVWEGTDEKVGT